MNRPYWLGIVYAGAFFLPPSVGAAVAALVLANQFDLHGWQSVLLYLVCLVPAIAIWLVAVVAWARRTSSESKSDGGAS
jgi:MFS family permease